MKINVLVPIFCFLASVVSCGAPPDSATEGAQGDTVSMSQAVSSDKAAKCKDQCKDLENPAKNACKAECEAGGGSECAPATGQPCGCENAGVFLCNGTCSIVSPINPDCDTCGGQTLCNGLCSLPLPRDYNLPCGCGGRFTCTGTCSVPCNN